MQQHVNSPSRQNDVNAAAHQQHLPCNLPRLRQIASVRPYLSRSAAARPVGAMVISRLAYCISVFTGLPADLIARLQRGRNNAARLVMKKIWDLLTSVSVILCILHVIALMSSSTTGPVFVLMPSSSFSYLFLYLLSPDNWWPTWFTHLAALWLWPAWLTHLAALWLWPVPVAVAYMVVASSVFRSTILTTFTCSTRFSADHCFLAIAARPSQVLETGYSQWKNDTVNTLSERTTRWTLSESTTQWTLSVKVRHSEHSQWKNDTLNTLSERTTQWTLSVKVLHSDHSQWKNDTLNTLSESTTHFGNWRYTAVREEKTAVQNRPT